MLLHITSVGHVVKNKEIPFHQNPVVVIRTGLKKKLILSPIENDFDGRSTSMIYLPMTLPRNADGAMVTRSKRTRMQNHATPIKCSFCQRKTGFDVKKTDPGRMISVIRVKRKNG